jgi:uncharacterized protein YaaQ
MFGKKLQGVIVKLIVTTLDKNDVDKVLTALTEHQLSVTHISSTGGLLSPGDSTLLIGVDELQVSQAMKIITDLASKRDSLIAYPHGGMTTVTGYVEVPVGGFTSFVLNIDHFEQV